ncbi:hypothetical protein C8Q80DRAFT_75229 [Daedaleopsis nitida]|nr:hypothetical protein C8Q80DRAFT_75229 [Daedaleopsis nitida]
MLIFCTRGSCWTSARRAVAGLQGSSALGYSRQASTWVGEGLPFPPQSLVLTRSLVGVHWPSSFPPAQQECSRRYSFSNHSLQLHHHHDIQTHLMLSLFSRFVHNQDSAQSSTQHTQHSSGAQPSSSISEASSSCRGSASAATNTPLPRPPPPPCRTGRRKDSRSSRKKQRVVVYDEIEADNLIEVQGKRFCVPHPDWSWAAEEPITHVKDLQVLDGKETQCTTILQRGLLGYRPVTFINRRWTRPSTADSGLYRELKLFTSDAGLRPFQGVLVPKLINVYDDFESVSLLFEPPHHSFWMCASASMPYILKKAVVDAYYDIHQAGILHGSPELRNIVIGGDCQVMLLDFSRARWTVEVPTIGLEAPSKRDFDFELREVMFKLDYEGAQRRENAKMERTIAMTKRNKSREELRDLQRRGIHDGPVEPDEVPSGEDSWQRPVHPKEWNRWVMSLSSSEPKQIVVPGQSPEQIAAASKEFDARVKWLEEIWKRQAVAPMVLRPMDFPLPVSLYHVKLDTPATDSTDLNGKRKAFPDPQDLDNHRPTKRPRTSSTSALKSECDRVGVGPVYKYSSTSYRSGTSENLLPAASDLPTGSSRPPPVKVRDFAHEPYDGPRGFYVPHPPTEYMMNANHTAYIINGNAAECGRLGLPYFRGDIESIRPPHYRRHPHKCFPKALGTLKRRRAEALGTAPVTHEELRAAKRHRLEEDRRAWLAEEDTTIRFNDVVTYAECPKSEDDLQISWNPWNRPKRGVLKEARPVRTVSYDLNSWLRNDDSSSSKPSMDVVTTPTQPQQTAPATEDGTFAYHSPESSLDAGNSSAGWRPAEADLGEALMRQRRPAPSADSAAGSLPTARFFYGPYATSPTPPLRRSDVNVRLSSNYLRTEDEVEEDEVLRILAGVWPSSAPRIADEDDERSDKTMLDNICIWLRKRGEPDGSDVWDD